MNSEVFNTTSWLHGSKILPFNISYTIFNSISIYNLNILKLKILHGKIEFILVQPNKNQTAY